jgi:hypothetical protein
MAISAAMRNNSVIPAKAGIHLRQQGLDSGSPLRCGPNDDFRP